MNVAYGLKSPDGLYLTGSGVLSRLEVDAYQFTLLGAINKQKRMKYKNWRIVSLDNKHYWMFREAPAGRCKYQAFSFYWDNQSGMFRILEVIGHNDLNSLYVGVSNWVEEEYRHAVKINLQARREAK
jgi:hypothetical protein